MPIVMRLTSAAARTPPWLTMLAISLIYALCFVAIKAGLQFAPPLLFAALRTFLGGVFLLAIIRTQRIPLRPPRSLWPWIGAIGLVATTFTYGAMFLSPGRTGAGIASILGNLQPLIVIVLATAFLSERLTRYSGAALVLGVGGATLTAAPALVGPDGYGLPGAVLALAASIGAAVGSVLIKRVGRFHVADFRGAVVTISAWQLVVGSVPLFLLSALLERHVHLVWNGELVSIIVVLALVGTSLPTVIWYSLIQHHDVGRLSIFLFLVPVFGTLIAFVAFREPLSVPAFAGMALTIAAVIAIASDRQPSVSDLKLSPLATPASGPSAVGPARTEQSPPS
ncbi:MAG: DMT family transporter [Candidatus Dormibacteria bacterium]